jgi:endonuclease/exonuclease/phosphatase family metal-dependent hydrolase
MAALHHGTWEIHSRDCLLLLMDIGPSSLISCRPMPDTGRTMAGDGPQLRLATYNLHSLRDDSAALDATVRGFTPDILVVQEALRWFNPFTWFVNLARRFGMASSVGGLRSQGNVILTGSRVTVHEHWFFRYPLAFGHYPRGAVFLRCSADGVAFVVAGSHLSPDAAMRLRQAGLFKEELDKARAAAAAPALVGLDVNESAGEPAWQVVAAGMLDAAEVTGQGGVPTFSTGDPQRRIDAIFVDPSVAVVEYSVVDSPQSRAASDHFPVVAPVAVPAA